jgi:hypothetical protein
MFASIQVKPAVPNRQSAAGEIASSGAGYDNLRRNVAIAVEFAALSLAPPGLT